jgi:hypothetical protein
MTGEQDWDEPRLFLAERTQAIRRGFALLAIPLLLIAGAYGLFSLASKAQPQLTAAQEAHVAASFVDQR